MDTLTSAHVILADKVWDKTASVAQSAERRTCNADVGGSIPSAGSKNQLMTPALWKEDVDRFTRTITNHLLGRMDI